ncbi:MAG: Sodium Bile acid symporter family protein [Planctomycetaceae bacterium]|nr:Sodium Bile acid symporter family protein [Planctomycetaceae bacterium]
MTLDKLMQIAVAITLIEMMITIGLKVTYSQLAAVATNWRLVAWAFLANYVCVPAAAIGLLLLFPTSSAITAGFLILAVCPGGPYGPPFTMFARGNIAAAVGVMVLLAGSSAVLAPLLLASLLPLMTGAEPLQVNSAKLVVILLATQLLPLCVGLSIRHWWSPLADRLEKPAQFTSKVLNVFSTGLVLFVQFHTLSGIRPIAFAGMLALLLFSFAAGWLAGGPAGDGRRSMTLVTSLRNVAVSLVIATSAFPGTSATTAVVAYALVEITGSLLLAVWWGRRP